jgi:predicted ATPase
VELSHFKNVVSTAVDIDPRVTCLVGKNESGKTSFLEALYRVNPARQTQNSAIDLQKQYPAWLEKRHRRQGKDLEGSVFCAAAFTLTPVEIAHIERSFGKGSLPDPKFELRVDFSGKRVWWFGTDDRSIANHFVETSGYKGHLSGYLGTPLNQWLPRIQDDDAIPDDVKADLLSDFKITFGDEGFARKELFSYLQKITPKVLYFSEFSQLPGTVDMDRVLAEDVSDLTDGELTARTLLTMAGAASEYLTDTDYETRKRELENVSNDISKEILSYWSTNTTLRMLVDLTQTTRAVPHGRQSVVKEIKFRIWDDTHQLSLELEGRSSGFRWFFSFLAAFSEYEYTEESILILLDEPALGLHARAQRDFLRFIEERLAPRCQVIFTTHSPFMVQPEHLERVRLVEDKGIDKGSTISADIMSTDRDTLFPLQSALGYDLVQHLLIAPHNLLVEGPSDHTYLLAMSDQLKELKRTGLDERFSIVTTGGLDTLPTFVALLGGHLDIAVLIDSSTKGHQRLESFGRQGLLKKNGIVSVGDILGRKPADIEDLFEEADYLKLYRGAFGKAPRLSSKDKHDRIIARISRAIGEADFNHRRPADFLMRSKAEFFDAVSEETLGRFERLFIALNATLA